MLLTAHLHVEPVKLTRFTHWPPKTPHRVVICTTCNHPRSSVGNETEIPFGPFSHPSNPIPGTLIPPHRGAAGGRSDRFFPERSFRAGVSGSGLRYCTKMGCAASRRL